MSEIKSLSTDVIKQHTVPRFLLNEFGFKGKGKGKFKKLFTFDKKNNRAFQVSVMDASTRNTFYNIDNHPDRASLEPLLGIYELGAAPIIKKLLQSRTLKILSAKDKVKLAQFIAIQRARSLGELERIIGLQKAMSDKMIAVVVPVAEVEEALGEDPESGSKDVFLSIILKHDDSVRALLQMDWMLQETDLNNPFYISDNPVTLHNQNRSKNYGNLGLSSIGIEVYMPLSSTLTLVMFCPTITAQFKKDKEEIQALLSSGYNFSSDLNPHEVIKKGDDFIKGRTVFSKPEHTIFLNSLQVLFSEQYVFCQVNRFDLVKQMIDENEQFKSGPRITIL